MIKLKRLFLTAAVSLTTVITLSFGCLTAGAAEVNGTSALSMKYYTGTASSKQWKTFKTSATDSGITGLRLTTDPNASYYLLYKTWNNGKNAFYPALKSTDNGASDYAGTGNVEGSNQKEIQCLNIEVHNKSNDSIITSEIIVMYRVKANGKWLSWVGSADQSTCRNIMQKYGLEGGLETSDDYAGIPGRNIEGLEIRLFDERGGQGEPDEGITEISGKEESPALSFTANGSQSFVSFDRVTPMQSSIDTIKIVTPASKQYYLSYKVKAEGAGDYYSAVDSRNTSASEYAGIFGRPIQRVKIDVLTKGGSNVTENIVVMYRVYTDRWLPWVSNADPEWMKSVKLRYNIAGELDTSYDGFAGLDGKNIKAVEIRLFEEKDIITDVSHGNEKLISAPYISQVGVYPTGCESVSTVMALQYAGVDISVDTFIDDYLDKSSSTYDFDPNVSFGGNPRSSSGIGCYAPVIKKALDKALAGSDFYGENITGKTLSQLCSEYIDNGIPVITWATTDMKDAYPGKQLATMTWIAPEHCLLLVGYDDSCYIFNDPQRQANKHYLKADVEAAYKALGSQAVVVLEKEPVCPDAPSTAEPQEYVRENSAEQSIYNNAVDLSRGSHIIRTELISPAAGGKTAFTISYDSSRLVSGSLGAGWYHNFETRLEAYGDIVWIYETPSVRCGYARTDADTYAARSHGRENYILTRLDDGWVLDRNKNGKLYFDLSGRLTAAEDKNLNKTVISYLDNKITITDPVGATVTLTLTDGLVTGVTDGASVFNLTYKNGYLLSVGNNGGETVYYTYNEQGRIETGAGGRNGYFRNVYDGAGRLSEQVTDEESGIKTAFAYTETADGLTVGVTAAGGKKSLAYFSGGMLVKFQAEDGGVTEYAYDGNLNLTSVLYPDGKGETTVYNALNLPVRHTDVSGRTKAMAYDDNNNLISAVYDDKGDLNGDGAVDVRDLVRMKRLLADGDTPVNSGSADINADSSENASDSAVLQRYLFGFRDGHILCETFVYNEKNQLVCHTGTDGTVTRYNPESSEAAE